MYLDVSIWSDIACPWCFVGKQRLEQALAHYAGEPNALPVQLRWRAFELDPRPRVPDNRPYAERLAIKYGRTLTQSQQMIDTMAAAICAEGGDVEFDQICVANTFNAHRLIQWAGSLDRSGVSLGVQQKLTDALMRAYLGRGLNPDDTGQLLKVVRTLGLDELAAGKVLSGDEFAREVRNDEEMAQQYGITGVPFFMIGRYGTPGAQDPVTLLDLLKQAAADLSGDASAPSKGAPRCDPGRS